MEEGEKERPSRERKEWRGVGGETRKGQEEAGEPEGLNLCVLQVEVLGGREWGGRMACGPSLRRCRHSLGLKMGIKDAVVLWFSIT